MGFWRRMFSSEYRAGKGAEAAGHLVEASRKYAEAGADDALLRVIRKRAGQEADPRAAVQLHRQALEVAADWCPNKPLATTCRADLAKSLRRLWDVVEPEEVLELAVEAAALFADAGAHAEAGAAYERAGDFEKATEAYIQAGDLDAVERTAAVGDPSAGPGVELVPWVEVLLDQGRVDEALQAVAEAEQGNTSEARQARAMLEAKLPPAGRLVLAGPSATYRLVADEVVEVGRDPGLALVLTVQAVSRRHLSLQRAGAALVVANLSTSGTVTVNGEALLAPKVVEPPAPDARVRIGLDGGCELVARVVGATWHVQPHVGGLGGDILVLGATAALDGMTLVCQGRWWQHEGAIATRGQRLGPFTVK